MYQVELVRKPIAEFLTDDDLWTYYLPSVQRDFVWDEDEVQELIDSLLSGYPTGVITILETNIQFPSVPLIDVKNPATPNTDIRRYVLDGQQRLTSLLLIRDGWKINRCGKEISIDPIHFNPDDGTLRKKGKREFGYDFSKLIRWTLHKESPIQSIPRIQKTLEEVNKEFLIRPLGFFIVKVNKGAENEDKIYSDMAEIFTRINRAGIKLGNLEMFLSFFASASVGKQEITDLYEQMKSKYELDLEPIIRLVFSNFGLTQNQISKVESFKKSTNRIKQNYTKERIFENIEKSKRSIEITMNILKNELGISNADILPSQTSLVVLSKHVLRNGYASLDKIPLQEINKMLRWFIISSFHGLYSSQTDKRLEDDIKIVGSSGTFPIDQLLDSMARKSLRIEIQEQDFKNIDFNILRGSAGKRFLFALYILLHRNGATDWTGNPISNNKKNLARHHILPKENDTVRAVLDDEVIRNHLGNLTFIDKGKNEEIGDGLPEDYLSKMSLDALKEHFIPLDKNLWKPENYEEFINTRMDLIWRSFDKFMTNLRS